MLVCKMFGYQFRLPFQTSRRLPWLRQQIVIFFFFFLMIFLSESNKIFLSFRSNSHPLFLSRIDDSLPRPMVQPSRPEDAATAEEAHRLLLCTKSLSSMT